MPTGEARNDRRRVWSRGFTTEAIKEYQEIIVEKANQLAEGLDARIKSEVDLGEWLGFFAYVSPIPSELNPSLTESNILSFDFMAEMM